MKFIFYLEFGWKRCLIRSAIVFLGVAVGESVPRFDIVMVLIGGSLTGLLVFIFPPLLYSKIIALKTRSKKIQSLTPEVYSSSERCQNNKDMSTNPRIHSKSIYYGGLTVPRTEYHRYSYVYYNELESELDEIVDYENDHIIDSEKFLMTKRIYDNKPIFIDASQSYNVYKQIIIPEEPISESTTYYNYKKWNNCFSYLIVFFGIIITISSTYINMKNTIHYVQFTPPCIINITILQNSI